MSFRPLNFAAPASSPLYKLIIENFKGVDLVSGESNFSPSRAAELQNFIRNKVGQVKKRGGFVAYTGDPGKRYWIKNWEGGTAYFENGEVVVGGLHSTVILKEKLGQSVSVVHAIGEGLGKYFYLLLSCLDEAEKTRFAVMRFEHTGQLWKNENVRTYELKAQAFDNVATATTGTIGSVASSIVNAAQAVLGKYNKVLPFMEFVPTPTIVNNASPKGGGNLLQSPNILSPYVQETFCVTEGDLTGEVCKRFQLSLQDIALTDDTEMISSETWMTEGKYWTMSGSTRKLTADGAAVLQKSVRIEKYVAVGETDYEWKTMDLSKIFVDGGVDFVNTESAALWIPSANVGIAPVEGEANVRITYMRNYDEYIDGLEELMTCNLSTCYGVGGYKDRLFLSGENKIYYSGMDDPMYFGELCYIEPCFKGVSIVAMGGQGQFLYAVDSDGITHVISGTVTEDDSATYLQDAAFIIADRVQGEKPIGSVLKIFGGEFCYLSEEGVVAIRHDSFYDKRYAQNRSRMLGDSIKGKIVGATVWGSFLVIATETQLYLLDEMQQTRLEDYKYSGVQYEVFPFTFDMDFLGTFSITKVWSYGDNLYFQMLQDGKYYTHVYDENSAEDIIGEMADGEVKIADIVAEWVTPPLSLEEIHRKKRIQEFWLAVGEEGDCVSVDYRTNQGKEWRVIRQDWGTLRQADGRFIAFDYNSIDYGAFSYNGQVPKLQMSVRGRPSRPFNSVQFRFKSMGHHGLTLTSFGFYYKKEVI